MGKCMRCGGKGRWIEMEGDNEMTLVSKWCNDCHGSGVDLDPEEGDAFDIGGSSYNDEDDD